MNEPEKPPLPVPPLAGACEKLIAVTGRRISRSTGGSVTDVT